jgi:hypothetical protein
MFELLVNPALLLGKTFTQAWLKDDKNVFCLGAFINISRNDKGFEEIGISYEGFDRSYYMQFKFCRYH